MKGLVFVATSLSVVFCCVDLRAAEIRHFSLPTQRSARTSIIRKEEAQHFATDPIATARKARRYESAAKLGSMFRIVVLKDPNGNGSLVYALATNPNPNNIVVSVHFRVTVSSDDKVERVDQLGTTSMVIPKNGPENPPGYTHTGFYAAFQIEDTEPLETLVYLSLLHHERCAVVTSDGVMWFVENGKIMKNHNPENI